MSVEKFEQCLLAAHQHIKGMKGAACPRPETMELRWRQLSPAAQRARCGHIDIVALIKYCKDIHASLPNTLTQDPNKDSAQMSTIKQFYGRVGARVKHSNHTAWPGFGTVMFVQGDGSLAGKIHIKWEHNGRTAVHSPQYLTIVTDEVPQESNVVKGLSPTQRVLLLALVKARQEGKEGLRSDEGARAADVPGPADFAHHGLALRAKGLVSTTNDGGAYVLWSVQPTGMAAGLEIAAIEGAKERTKEAAIQAAKAQEDARLAQVQAEQEAHRMASVAATELWLVWSPAYQLNNIRFDTQQEAMARAEQVARNFPGATFHVLKGVTGFKLVDVQQQRTITETVSKLEQL